MNRCKFCWMLTTLLVAGAVCEECADFIASILRQATRTSPKVY